MPEILSFTDDSQFPNIYEWVGYQTFVIYETETSAWSRLMSPRSFTVFANNHMVGEFAVGRDGTGQFRFEKNSYGVQIENGGVQSDTYFLEIYDLEFERLLSRSMSHANTSVVGISGFEVRRSMMGRQYGLESLQNQSGCVVKIPAGQKEHREHGVLARVLIRDGHPEPDLFILNSLMLSHRMKWHTIVASIAQ